MRFRIIFILSFSLLLFSCSTKKNTRVSRAYHNLTAHYNAYFNGKESYKEGMLAIKENLQDDFSKILPVFIYDNPSANNVSGQMERAIKKSIKVIKLHSITAKPKRKKGTKSAKDKAFYAQKEYNKWVDNAYLLMGKSYFIEKNYKGAEKSFTWIIANYPNTESKYNAEIWLIRTYIQEHDFDKALDYLQKIEADKDFPPKRLNKMLFPTYADFYLKQKDYEKTIPWLLKSITTKSSKFDKKRYKYILAQIYQKTGNPQKAFDMYKEVIAMRPNYDMEFSAKIQRAILFDQSSGDSRLLKKQLNKMLRDEKNIEYKDQIYYALANIFLKEKNETQAIKNYKLSTYNSTSNVNQKALSYLALGDIYFKKLNYVIAQAYYDSTITNLTDDYPNYKEIKNRADNLGELVTYINIINREDSLLHLAHMSPRERDKVINSIIQKIKDEERRKAEEARQHQMDLALSNENNRNGLQTNIPGGKWYFYNPIALGMGQADFKRRWGNRKLEDNWRRKNKTVVSEDEEQDENEATAQNDTKKKKIDAKSKAYYLQNIPLSDSAQVASNQKIENALFYLAKTYRDLFLNYNKAIKTYEKLLKKYPKTSYKLACYYELYQLYQLQKNTTKANKYKTLILQEFPNSIPAKILSDPNYLAKVEKEKNKVNNIYTKTYQAFQENNYKLTLQYISYIEDNYPQNPIMPKFQILKAQAMGGLGNVDSMKITFKNIIKKYPETPEKELADFILSKVETGGYTNDTQRNSTQDSTQQTNTHTVINNINDSTIVETQTTNYKYQAEETHLYAMVATGEISDYNRLKYNIIKYNADYFLMFDFQISDRNISHNTKIIMVKPLNNAKEAMKYLKLIVRNKEIYNEFKSLKIEQFVISESNLKILLKEKNIEDYISFFKKNYK